MSEMVAVRYPTRPSVTKRRSTLLDVAQFDDAAFEWNDGIALFDSVNCLTFQNSAVFCAPNTKDLSDLPTAWNDGVRFAVYGGFTCEAIGYPEDVQSRVQEAFRTGESTAVESALVAYRFAANAAGSGLPGEWPAPTSISAAVATPALALAAMEEYAAKTYVGQGVIHLPVGIASQLAATEAITWDGNILRTKLGSKVVAGAGYSLADPKKMYVTGEVLVSRSEEIHVSEMGIAANEIVTLAERGYLVAVDCFAATVSVT